MYLKKMSVLVLSLVLLLSIGAAFIVILKETSHEPYEEQLRFLQANGFLLQDKKAIFDYAKAASLLKEYGISSEVIKKEKKMSPNGSRLMEPFYKSDVLDVILQGAKKRQLGLPKSDSVLFWENNYKIEGEVVHIDDLYLCVDYVCFLLKYGDQTADSQINENVAYASFAMGIQMSKYRDQVLRTCAVACKFYALKWFINYGKEQQNEYAQFKRFFQDVEIENEKIRKNPIEWPLFIEVSFFIYKYWFVWFTIGLVVICIFCMRRRGTRETRDGNRKQGTETGNKGRKQETRDSHLLNENRPEK